MKKSITQKYKIIFTKIAFGLYFSLFAAFMTFVIINESSAKTDFLNVYKNDLEAIETYLNGIKNLSAKFVQKSANGVAQGKFLLARPGKMRVEYIGEPKILIVVNGAILSYKDIELDEVSNLSTNTTPASFLTRNNISFQAKDVEITNVKKDSDTIAVSIIKKNRTEAGEFTIFFKTLPTLAFTKMQVTNDIGDPTTVTLSDVSFPNNLDDNLFIIRNKNLPF